MQVTSGARRGVLTGSCESSDEGLEHNSGPPKEQQMLLTAGPSLHPLKTKFKSGVADLWLWTSPSCSPVLKINIYWDTAELLSLCCPRWLCGMWGILGTSFSVLESPYHLANGAQPVTSSTAGCGEGRQRGLWRGILQAGTIREGITQSCSLMLAVSNHHIESPSWGSRYWKLRAPGNSQPANQPARTLSWVLSCNGDCS